MDYERLLNHLRNRRDYFNAIDFVLIGKDFESAVNAIEALMEENKKEIDKKQEEKEVKKEP